eukprot:COSAG02_NODE_1785_length_10940_cov_9.153399_7_plen_55_part_00
MQSRATQTYATQAVDHSLYAMRSLRSLNVLAGDGGRRSWIVEKQGKRPVDRIVG